MTTQHEPKKIWEAYCASELALIRPILSAHTITLDTVQPHIAGERYLMHAVTTTSGKKLILLGTDASGAKVVIKATRDKSGTKEILHERICKEVLKKIDFAGDVFHTPEECVFIQKDGYTITVQRFIEQECSFLERPLETQFKLALASFKSQESAHATTFSHRALIADVFGIRDAQTYLTTFKEFEMNSAQALPDATELHTTLQKAYDTLVTNKTIIEQYSGFLTHTDFVPHNIRVQNGTIYLLDHSSLTFGNKYEGWARFINFMTLYNPALQKALEQYVRDNRTTEESISLRMMRIYRLGEIIWYYIRTLGESEGNLHTLNTERVYFWNTVLTSVLTEEEVSEETLNAYKARRDALRSVDEKARQIGLH